MERICFFMGSRGAPSCLLKPLIEQVERLVEQEHVTEFLVGQHGNFDRLATLAVACVKERYPLIRLTLLLSYYSPGKQELPECFDGSLYPEGMETVPKRLAILRANQYAAGLCDFLVCYATYSGGNTQKLLDKIRKKRGGHPIHILMLSADEGGKEKDSQPGTKIPGLTVSAVDGLSWEESGTASERKSDGPVGQ